MIDRSQRKKLRQLARFNEWERLQPPRDPSLQQIGELVTLYRVGQAGALERESFERLALKGESFRRWRHALAKVTLAT